MAVQPPALSLLAIRHDLVDHLVAARVGDGHPLKNRRIGRDAQLAQFAQPAKVAVVAAILVAARIGDGIDGCVLGVHIAKGLASKGGFDVILSSAAIRFARSSVALARAARTQVNLPVVVHRFGHDVEALAVDLVKVEQIATTHANDLKRAVDAALAQLDGRHPVEPRERLVRNAHPVVGSQILQPAAVLVLLLRIAQAARGADLHLDLCPIQIAAHALGLVRKLHARIRVEVVGYVARDLLVLVRPLLDEAEVPRVGCVEGGAARVQLKEQVV